MKFEGYNIIENEYMLMDSLPQAVERGLKERLFTRPWKPFKKIKYVRKRIPSDKAIVRGNDLVMHPSLAKELIKGITT